MFASFVPCALCNQNGRCILGGWSLLRGREREREMWCCNRFPWSTLCILLWRRGGFGLDGLRGRSRHVNLWRGDNFCWSIDGQSRFCWLENSDSLFKTIK
jgi:hypothetical protein